MVSFSVIRNVAARSRSLLLNATQQQQRRTMSLGGHHGPPPEWTGVDKIVRKYCPEDYQLSIAILSGYFGIYVLVKIVGAFSKKKPVVEEKVTVTVSAASDTTGVPALESSAFEKFVETAAFEKLLENESQLSKLVESA